MNKPLHPDPNSNQKPRRLNYLVGASLVVTSFAFQVPVSAVQFESGEFFGSIDNTISYGTTWRVQSRDRDLLGLTSTTLPNGTVPPGGPGGRAFSVNGDDGNLNYDKGLVSNVVKITSELSLEHNSGYGAFVRGSAFYDFENEDGDREKIDLSDEALELVGSDIELLDAYVFSGFEVGDVPVDLRLGNQVVSWGESTFIQNGINVLNPIDVSAIRVPGAELREALLPVNMLWGSAGVTLNSSVEGFYQFEWDETEPDPSGSYFSTNDFATDGGNKLMLGFGSVPDIIPFGPAAAASIGASPTGVAVPRGADREADDSGQFGLAYRVYVPEFGDTELGFYYMNYHSRLPIISAKTGTLAGLAGGDYVGSARYFTEFPEDIQLLGLSFNTQVGTTGWALQGELSYKKDVPLQVDDTELLFAALSPLAIPEAAAGTPGVGTLLASTNQVAPGGVGFATEIPGFAERDVVQVQVTGTRVYANVFGADQLAVVGEIGITHVNAMPDQNELRLEAPGTFTSGNPVHTLAGVQPATEDADNFADASSAGYQIRGRLTYNNAIGPIALIPTFAFRHDFSGNSPGPGGNFLEGRKAVTLGVAANLRNEWTAEVGYTNFFGAGRHNLINDRDFISFNIKYSR
ncbi:MAG: hypothetical protein MAG794_00887 [Gammaproteobacteria bacterium]|nr:hypothetical protein [Gammaproteobacteria bacterium]